MKIPKIKKITHIAKANSNLEDMINQYLQSNVKSLRMIVYTYNPLTNHYGTGTYKITPANSLIQKLIREELGLSIKKSLKRLGIIINMYIGYSTDENNRALKMKDTELFKYQYPLIEENMNFKNTIDYLKKNNKTIYRSACYICPFRNDTVNGMGWLDIYMHDRKNWIKLLELDIKIRDHNKVKCNYYLDNSCIPLWILYKSTHKNFEKYKKWDQKGWSDFNLKNRKWKKQKIESCSSPSIGSCSL